MKTLTFDSICLFVSALAAFGQTDRGAYYGTVADATGAVIPEPVLKRKIWRPAASTAGTRNRQFTLPQLPAGTMNSL
jgi:hypothetical protein